MKVKEHKNKLNENTQELLEELLNRLRRDAYTAVMGSAYYGDCQRLLEGEDRRGLASGVAGPVPAILPTIPEGSDLDLLASWRQVLAPAPQSAPVVEVPGPPPPGPGGDPPGPGGGGGRGNPGVGRGVEIGRGGGGLGRGTNPEGRGAPVGVLGEIGRGVGHGAALNRSSTFTNQEIQKRLQQKIFEGEPEDRSTIYDHILENNSEDLQNFSEQRNSLFAKELIENLAKVQALKELISAYIRSSDPREEIINRASQLRASLIILRKKEGVSLAKLELQAIKNNLQELEQAVTNRQSSIRRQLKGEVIAGLAREKLVRELGTLKGLVEGIGELRKEANSKVLYDILLDSTYYKRLTGQEGTLPKEACLESERDTLSFEDFSSEDNYVSTPRM